MSNNFERKCSKRQRRALCRYPLPSHRPLLQEASLSSKYPHFILLCNFSERRSPLGLIRKGFFWKDGMFLETLRCAGLVNSRNVPTHGRHCLQGGLPFLAKKKKKKAQNHLQMEHRVLTHPQRLKNVNCFIPEGTWRGKTLSVRLAQESGDTSPAR